jgi:uncharacterized protein (TIGR02391 family)
MGLPCIRVVAYRQKLDGLIATLNAEYCFTKRGASIKQMYTKRKKDKTTRSVWELLHPKVVKISRSRFESGHFADSVEAALKEINRGVRHLVKRHTGQEFDGADLMNRAFSLQNPIITLADLSTETGKNIQKGYMQIFAGTITGIRNPKAHDNIDIKGERAIHFLYLTSLLMFKIDERVA